MNYTHNNIFHQGKTKNQYLQAYITKITIALILIFFMVSRVSIAGQDKNLNLLWKEVKKTAGTGMLNIINTQVAGKYAVCGVLFKSKNKPSNYAYYFLKKKGNKWVFVTATSPTMTTDFLKKQGVPSSVFPKLIDQKWIEFTTPIIQALKRKKGKVKYFYDTVQVQDKWAKCTWTTADGHEGLAILKKKNGKWTILYHGGGALSEGEFKKYGVPSAVIKKFLRGDYLDCAILEASGFGNYDAVMNLVSADPQLADVKNIYGLTPLHRAALYGKTKVVKILIGKGADINAKDQLYGDTPLHKAVWNGHVETVKLLVSKGANVNAKDKKGKTPLYYAKKRGHKDVVKYLK